MRVIVSDPPWSFSDKLTMSDVKRGSEANYATLSVKELKALDIKSVAGDDAVLALWCPSSLLKDGIEVMEEWGFSLKQTHVWVKTKKNPFIKLVKIIKKIIKCGVDDIEPTDEKINADITDLYNAMDINTMLAFGMGRLWRQSHEICLIGVRGKPYKYLKNRSQRSVHFAPVLKHSSKPEYIQNMLDQMFDGDKMEFFARRYRSGWECCGLELNGEDVKDSITRLQEKFHG